METPPLSLYIHIPWCIRKCPYCDFNSHQLKDGLDDSRYVAALLADLDQSLDDELQERRIESIFIGGGTPSLFAGHKIADLLDRVEQRLAFSPDIEITMEANPGSVEHDAFGEYRAAGINRLSLGVQSFNDDHLQKLGRIHDSDTARSAIGAALDAGFENINLDIMYGLPGQSVSQALNDCEQALSFSPTHLSFYELTIEPNTLFHRHPPEVPDQDQILDMHLALVSRLLEADFLQYEVSAFSNPGRECRHNMNYWEFGDYLGIGAGAHSKITSSGDIYRNWKQKHPESFMSAMEQGREVRTITQVPEQDLLFEFMLNALRLKDGVSVDLLTARTHLSKRGAEKALENAIRKSWISITDQRLGCTPSGYLMINEILSDLLPSNTELTIIRN